jgi:hypothetical protein
MSYTGRGGGGYGNQRHGGSGSFGRRKKKKKEELIEQKVCKYEFEREEKGRLGLTKSKITEKVKITPMPAEFSKNDGTDIGLDVGVKLAKFGLTDRRTNETALKFPTGKPKCQKEEKTLKSKSNKKAFA